MNPGPIDTPFLSLDLWDTVLRRRCHPDEVKLYTAQRMILLLQTEGRLDIPPAAMELLAARQAVEARIGARRRQEGYDDEYEIEEVLRACLLELTGESAPESEMTRWVETLVCSEIEQEIRVTCLDSELPALLEQYRYGALYILSDFYMSADKIRKILRAHSPPFAVDGYFISCDSGYNKRSGRLFEYACSELAIEPPDLIHIGDNRIVDVDMAQKSGLRAVHFVGEQGEAERIRLQNSFESRRRSVADRALLFNTGGTDESGEVGRTEQEQLRAYGRFLAPLFVGFSLFIQEIAGAGGHKAVFFFTREGRFFKRVFDRVSNHTLFGMKAPTSHLLPVSRLATFFPSVRSIHPDEMMRLWSQYHTQSVNSFLGSLGMETAPFQDICRRLGLDPDVMVHNPREHRVFQSLFDDAEFVRLLTDAWRHRRHLLREFLGQNDFGVNRRALIVDIGWRGTIQDNLALLVPETGIEGCYLGLQDFFNPQPANTIKHGYIADDNRGEFHPMLRHVMPFEMLCFAAGGSATGYRRDASGRVTAEFQVDMEEDRIHNERIHFFQEGVLDAVDETCAMIGRRGIHLEELRHEARRLALQYLEDPPKVMCRAFHALKQDDTFGMARTIYPGSFSFRLRDRLFSGFSRSHRDRFLHDLERSGWPQCLLKSRYSGIFHLLAGLKRRVIRSMAQDDGGAG